MFLTNQILQAFDYTKPIFTHGEDEAFMTYIPTDLGFEGGEFAEMFGRPQPVETDMFDVAGFFTTPNIGFNIKHDGEGIYRNLLKDLERYQIHANNKNHTQDALINKIVEEFHLLVQFVGNYSQLLLVEYSKALAANDFKKALIILNHIYSIGAENTYKLPLIFECARTFLVKDLDINTIVYCPIEGGRTALCEMINILQTSTAKLNVLEFDNKIFKFPIGNLLNANFGQNQMPTILLPSCLIDTNLLLRTTYYTDCILADCLKSLGVTQDIVDKIKELLISNNALAVIVGKICLVACTYEAMFAYANANNTQIVGLAKGVLVERLYRCVIGNNGDGRKQEGAAWINLIAKTYFGPLKFENNVFC